MESNLESEYANQELYDKNVTIEVLASKEGAVGMIATRNLLILKI